VEYHRFVSRGITLDEQERSAFRRMMNKNDRLFRLMMTKTIGCSGG